MSSDAEIDARGLLCPLPVLRAQRRLRDMRPGELLRLLADDPAARIDVPHFCTEQGHELVSEESLGEPARCFVIRRGTTRPSRS